MRLPTVNKTQRRWEDSRQWCERLYQAHLDGNVVQVTVTPDTFVDVQASISANTRRFWSTRGFRVRTRTADDRLSMAVWLERVAPASASINGVAMAGARSVGPVTMVECVACGWQTERRRKCLTFDLGVCARCDGAMRVRHSARVLASDARAKRELAEQEGAA